MQPAAARRVGSSELLGAWFPLLRLLRSRGVSELELPCANRVAAALQRSQEFVQFRCGVPASNRHVLVLGSREDPIESALSP